MRKTSGSHGGGYFLEILSVLGSSGNNLKSSGVIVVSSAIVGNFGNCSDVTFGENLAYIFSKSSVALILFNKFNGRCLTSFPISPSPSFYFFSKQVIPCNCFLFFACFFFQHSCLLMGIFFPRVVTWSKTTGQCARTVLFQRYIRNL